MKGIIVRSTGSWYFVRDENGNRIECRLRGKFRIKGLKATNPVAVGDNVEFEFQEGDNTGVITKIYDRKNYIIRRSVNLSKISHILAANIDYAILIASISSPRTSTGFIDRFLVTAEAYEIPAAIVFNKIDIYDKRSMDELKSLRETYEKIGYKTFETSALNGTNIDLLKELMKDKISLFSGHSGVGKSLLINEIESGLKLKIGAISEVHLKGKHTTTYAEMHELSFGGFIIDTPGIKEFGLIDLNQKELAMYFPEMLSLVGDCKYYNCTHVHEPGCAVKEALEKGEVAESRHKNYLNMLSGNEMFENIWELK